jgi:hypothetical protein
MPTIALRPATSVKDGQGLLRRVSGDVAPLACDGPHQWVCGSCGHALATKMHDAPLLVEYDGERPLLLLCPECDTLNEVDVFETDTGQLLNRRCGLEGHEFVFVRPRRAK